ncbi:hypothetical protein [Haloarchaeobius sp. TZWWS8]|uniref:hypothetical protein n=1 Tax=Haloarchaeobius sp. TZWWS8 TaxID=3446121 RepID=UPI003EC148C7
MTPTMSLMLQVVAGLSVALIVALGGFATSIFLAINQLQAAVFGDADVDGWDGLDTEVRRNREALVEEGIR